MNNTTSQQTIPQEQVSNSGGQIPIVTRANRKIGTLWVALTPVVAGIVASILVVAVIGTSAIKLANNQITDENSFFTLILPSLGISLLIIVAVIVIGTIIGFKYLNKRTPDGANKYDLRSGEGSLSETPDEIRGWNWGAAGLTLYWGLYNRSWLTLLVILPFISIFWWIVAGIKGNEWAWRAVKWESVEEFKRSQDRWKVWGIVVFIYNALTSVWGVLALLGALVELSDLLNTFAY